MKTKLGYLTAVFSIVSITITAQHRSIAFEHGTFAEIKEKALKENKLIFMDAFTTWCGPCKQMARNVFTNDTVADYFNTNLVNAKIDMEKGEGIELAKKYEVQCYPNLLFIDGNGIIVHRVAGSMTSKDFITTAMDAKDPQKNFSYYIKNYDANKTNSEFLTKYIDARENTCLESDNLVRDYFALQKSSELTNEKNWKMIRGHVNSIDSKEFDYLIANREKFESLYSKDEVNKKLVDVCSNTLFNMIRQTPFNEAAYNTAKKKITSFNLTNSKLILFEADFSLAEKKGDWNTYAKLALANVDAYYLKDANTLNGIAWNFYEHVDNKEALQKSESWAKLACELDMNYALLDTYTAVLYKCGKKQLALETANKAVSAAKKENLSTVDYKSTTDLIEKIKALK